MANVSNENLILKIRGISDRVKQIQDEAGDILVRNIRSQARQSSIMTQNTPMNFAIVFKMIMLFTMIKMSMLFLLTTQPLKDLNMVLAT